MTWIVAGLGNPGERFERTRHNLGRMVVDELARRAGARFRKVRFLPLDLAEVHQAGQPVLLGKSQRFYNESGPVYASLARKREVDPGRLVAVHDDLDLAFGAMRVKLGGSTAGNHGLDSLVGGLGTGDFHRVRLGIGRPPGRQDPVDFVLQPFPGRLEADVAVLVDDAADAVLSLIGDGLGPTQDRFNRSGPR
ncbi:MAG TPA: aminoacyl-tRNA hydrolase [Actinomycetota bacterium]|jgi:PTH1 family peptidyl-tRNA hydrolase|nr:aminoacyl-tRNA hydrolase [Actinomycetota bacterium]